MRPKDGRRRGIETLLVRDSDHVFPNHAHDGYYVVGCMLRGAAWCFGPQREEEVVSEGLYCAFNPSQVHSGVPVGGTSTSYRMIYIPEESMIDAARECREGAASAPEFNQPLARVADGPALIERAARGALGGADDLEAETALLEFVAAMSAVPGFLAAGRPGTDSAAVLRTHPGLRRAAEFLAVDPARRIDLDELAGEAGLSKYHLIRSFKRAFGVPPHTYRTQARVEAAKLLVAAGMPFTEIALETGFSDQSHFHRAFKTFVGLTPGNYRAERDSERAAGRGAGCPGR